MIDIKIKVGIGAEIKKETKITINMINTINMIDMIKTDTIKMIKINMIDMIKIEMIKIDTIKIEMIKIDMIKIDMIKIDMKRKIKVKKERISLVINIVGAEIVMIARTETEVKRNLKREIRKTQAVKAIRANKNVKTTSN